MTTAFTAIPIKMTMSAMRFLGCDMAEPYRQRRRPPLIEIKFGVFPWS